MPKVKEKKSLSSAAFTLENKVLRTLWNVTYWLLFRFSPTPLFAYRRFILNLFGASLAPNVRIYPSVKVWFPSNLSMGENSTLGPRVEVYNQGFISIGRHCIISQGARFCASTHDYTNPIHPLLLAPISIGDDTWVCADAFIGPNVDVHEGCVIGACCVVMKDTEAWMVYAGNPAVAVKKRKFFRE